MKRRTLTLFAAAALGLAFSAPAQGAETRYSVANGCFKIGDAGPFRMKATTLGEYLLFSKDKKFLAAGSDGAAPADEPSTDSEWRLDNAAGGLKVFNLGAKKFLTKDGKLSADGAALAFAEATGCAAYPEVDVSATGTPAKGKVPYGETQGVIDLHMHTMAFEFLGGSVHCGRPWHKYGVVYALRDCVDHEAGEGCGAALENVLFGSPARCHDPVGWPTFKDWPHHQSLTHENSYYKWIERAWMGGLRVYVNLMVENEALCELYPVKRNACNEMDSVRLQIKDIRELERYIDAQSGGPGKGWFRIVTNPFQARQVINQGKLAVVQGIEISALFDCKHRNYEPKCDKSLIDRQFDEVYRSGVRQMELVNKFDNALAGVAGDGGTTGVVVNNGNKQITDTYWDLDTCQTTEGDKEQLAPPGTTERDQLVGNGLQAFLPPGATPVYPPAPHCNTRGLTDLGEYVVRKMIGRKMLVDPDHLSQSARDEVFSVVESKDYSGIVSSHSWSNEADYPRVYKSGGTVTPYAGSSTGFAKEWKKLRAKRSRRFYWGHGYGADMNGFGSQGGPRGADVKNPVRYPFKSAVGNVTMQKQKSGERVYDINKDGVAHYGLYPDWIEDLRKIAGNLIVKDMVRGAEAYLQTWERAEGVPPSWQCRSARARFTSKGTGKLRFGDPASRVLRRDGQPRTRGRSWRYCVNDGGRDVGRLIPVFDGKGKVALIASTAKSHNIRGVGPGDRFSGRGLQVRDAGGGAKYVFGVRRGRVTFVAVASRSAAKSLKTYLKLAGVR